MANPFVGYDNIVPFLAPQDIGSTATTCPYIDLYNAHEAAFLISFGAVTSATATDHYDITIEAATAEAGTEATIGFSYRVSGIVGTNTWGAVTTCASTGVEVGSTDDNKSYWIELDPAALAANDYRYVRAVITDDDDMSAGLVFGAAFLQTRYRQTTHLSATASASA